MDETTIGKRIQQLRKQKGLTQEALAEQLGVTAQAVSKWENDYACPDISILPRLANILGVSTDELLTGTQAKSGTVVNDVPETKKDDSSINWRGPVSRGGVCFGLLIVSIGAILLWSKIADPFPYSVWSLIWPLLILFVGASTLANKISSVFGWIVSATGVYFLLDNLNVLPSFASKALLPAAVVIIVGVCLVFSAIRQNRGKKKDGFACGKSGKTSSSFHTENGKFFFDMSFGEEKRVVNDALCRGGKADISFGGATLDLRNVEQFADGAVLNADVSFGSLTVLLPRTVRILEKKDISFASSNTHGSPDDNAPYTLEVNSDISFGSIDFRYEE